MSKTFSLATSALAYIWFYILLGGVNETERSCDRDAARLLKILAWCTYFRVGCALQARWDYFRIDRNANWKTSGVERVPDTDTCTLSRSEHSSYMRKFESAIEWNVNT